MKNKKFLILLFLLNANLIFSQAQFKISPKDFLWTERDDRTVDLLIVLEVTNIGNEPDKCSDLYNLNIGSLTRGYQYGRDLKFQYFIGFSNTSMKPEEKDTLFIVYTVPKDADQLKLYYSPDPSAANKLITESYDKWIVNNVSPQGYIEKGRDLFGRKDYYGAIVNYGKALIIDPDLKLNFDLGNAWLMIGDYDEAIINYKEATEEKEGKEVAFNNLGYAYFEKGYYNDAVSSFVSAYEIDNQHWDAALGAAISHYELGNYDDAKRVYIIAAKIENQLYKGMDGIVELTKAGYFYTDKQMVSINNLCKLMGYQSY